VAVPHRNCRYSRDTGRDELAFPELFKIEKEEALVVSVVDLSKRDWAANVESVIISALRVAQMLPGPRRVADGAAIGKWRAGIERFVDEVIKHRAVEVVRSGLHRVVEVAAACLSVLRVVVSGLDRDFLHGVDAGLVLLILLPPDAVGRILSLNADRMRTR